METFESFDTGHPPLCLTEVPPHNLPSSPEEGNGQREGASNGNGKEKLSEEEIQRIARDILREKIRRSMKGGGSFRRVF